MDDSTFFEIQNKLFKRAIAGDDSAREQMILDNMHVARQVAYSLMTGKSMTDEEKDDEIQAAYVIMIETLDKMIRDGYMYNISYLRTGISNGLKSYYRKEQYGIDNSSIKNYDVRSRCMSVKKTLSIYDDKVVNGIESDSNGIDDILDKVYLKEVISTLSDTEQKIIKLIVYDNLTQNEVGEILGMKQNTVSVKYRAILNKLKQYGHE